MIMLGINLFTMQQFLLCLVILGTQPNAAHAAELALSPHGYGLIRFGQSLKHAETILNEHPIIFDPAESCTYVEFLKYRNVRFMVEDGVITRADVTAAVQNTSGIKVGMSIAKAKHIQPRLKVKPHHYDPEGYYLTLSSQRSRFALVFETDKFKITDVRGGMKPSVTYVEGCL